ncbi:MAG: alkaline phosphatase family protein [Acidimicrobiales bacterium]
MRWNVATWPVALAGALALLAAGCSGATTPATAPATAPSTSAPTTTPAPPATVTGAPSAARPCGLGLPPASGYHHVVWIVMENRAYNEVVGSRSAPYLAHLAQGCGLATDYSGVAHPSLPNYIALTSGSIQGIHDDADPAYHHVGAPSIFSLLGNGWRALDESMPTPCDRTSAGEYAAKHNPAVYYTDLGASCAALDQPLGATPDVSARFTFVTPNLCHDMHDCSTAAGDAWLSRVVPQVLDSPQYRAGHTVVFITWDENDAGGTRVPTYVIAPSVAPGTQVATPLDHYSLLRSTENLLGLHPLLGAAATARGLRSAFGL